MNTFQGIVFSDGGVMLNYLDMNHNGDLSWSDESIGFEDQAGTNGVQISLDTVPESGTSYYVPATCTSSPAPAPAPAPAPSPPPSGGACTDDVCGTVSQTSTDGAGTTYRLSLTLSGNAKNVYTIYGDETSSLSMPASYQEAAPFGANIGGGDTAGALSSIGLDFDDWTASSGLSSDNGAVFWMSPDVGPTGEAVVAQITVTGGFTASVNAQGRSNSGEDYKAVGVTFESPSTPTNCAGSWSDWSECPATCGTGTQTRNFIVSTAPADGGQECPADEEQACEGAAADGISLVDGAGVATTGDGEYQSNTVCLWTLR
jgi:hypothetical protein